MQCMWNAWLHEPHTGGQSSPGILQSGQHASNGCGGECGTRGRVVAGVRSRGVQWPARIVWEVVESESTEAPDASRPKSRGKREAGRRRAAVAAAVVAAVVAAAVASAASTGISR